MRNDIKAMLVAAQIRFGKVTREHLVILLESSGLTKSEARTSIRGALYRGTLKEIGGFLELSGQKVKRKDTDTELLESCKGAINYLNSLTGSKFKPSGTSIELIKARLSEGYTFDDIKRVIDLKVKEWLGTPMDQYLRPSTLFNRTKFQNYAGQRTKKQTDLSSLLED